LKFSDTSSSFLDSSLESSVKCETEDSDEETAEAECKSSDSQRTKNPKTKSLNKQQMEELSQLWVFSDEEAKNVESELWLIHQS